MELINNAVNLLDLPIELIEIIIINSSGLTKFIMHFVTKFFWNLTRDSVQNRQSRVSFLTFFIENRWLNNKINKICSMTAIEGSLNILIWARSNNFYWDIMTCCYAAENDHLEVLPRPSAKLIALASNLTMGSKEWLRLELLYLRNSSKKWAFRNITATKR